MKNSAEFFGNFFKVTYEPSVFLFLLLINGQTGSDFFTPQIPIHKKVHKNVLDEVVDNSHLPRIANKYRTMTQALTPERHFLCFSPLIK
jgi:hypothetical protein